jgi:hypothetical protein
MAFDLINNKKNIIILLLSLIIAVILWSLAKTNETIVIERDFTFQVKTPTGLVVKGVMPDSIKMRIEAKKRQHNMLKNISPIIRLSYRFPGDYKFKLDETKISFPFLLGIEDYDVVFPDSIKVELDSLIKAEVSITSVKGMIFEPSKVTLTGPKSLVSDVKYLSPDSIPKGAFTTITTGNPLIEVYPSRIRVRQ